MRKNQIAWRLWAVGTVLIVLSWFSVVSPAVGWVGFAVGMFGSVLSWGIRPPRSIPPPSSTDDSQAPKV